MRPAHTPGGTCGRPGRTGALGGPPGLHFTWFRNSGGHAELIYSHEIRPPLQAGQGRPSTKGPHQANPPPRGASSRKGSLQQAHGTCHHGSCFWFRNKGDYFSKKTGVCHFFRPGCCRAAARGTHGCPCQPQRTAPGRISPAGWPLVPAGPPQPANGATGAIKLF